MQLVVDPLLTITQIRSHLCCIQEKAFGSTLRDHHTRSLLIINECCSNIHSCQVCGLAIPSCYINDCVFILLLQLSCIKSCGIVIATNECEYNLCWSAVMNKFARFNISYYLHHVFRCEQSFSRFRSTSEALSGIFLFSRVTIA